jgi:cytochrome b subunit of formate dehydrogenase
VLLVITYEIVRTVKGRTEKAPWLPIGKKGFAAFTFLSTLILILSGFLLWFAPNIPYLFGTIGFAFHEIAALLAIGSVVWHIYDKRRIL